jgi:hypothetical protein
MEGHIMKIRFAVGAAALILVGCSAAGCGGKTTHGTDKSESSATESSATQSSATQSSATSSAASTSLSTSSSATPAAAPAGGDKPNRDFLFGKWGTDGDCTLAIDLRPDGTSDGPFGDWSYNDGVISFVEDPDFKVTVTVIDDNTMQSTNGAGKASKMTRCP